MQQEALALVESSNPPSTYLSTLPVTWFEPALQRQLLGRIQPEGMVGRPFRPRRCMARPDKPRQFVGVALLGESALDFQGPRQPDDGGRKCGRRMGLFNGLPEQFAQSSEVSCR